MKVVVGSKNPVKIQATKEAFEKLWPKKNRSVIGLEVKSGVSDQPMSDEESIKGASNRAKKALKTGKADFGIGFEGGLHKIGEKWFDCGWVVVVNKKGQIGIATTVRVEIPRKMMRLIIKGKELGEVIDIHSGGVNMKQKEGHFGFITNGAITRAEGYRDGLIMALARFLHPELWE